MNAKALIEKKRDGGELTPEEVRFFALEGGAGRIPDYQITALLMAIFFRGMSARETADLARAMLESGNQLRFDGLTAAPTDKHSTGGVGDKISFLVAPLVAAAGVPVPMISGRSLGHTGGTLDKLESIPGFRADLSEAQMQRQIARVGCFISGQTESLAPADRKFYSLRDAASIVESIPLIVGSILSKKAAAGVKALALDVKVGTGAFMPELGQARELASSLVSVAGLLGIRARAHLTPMDLVLGRTAGNAIEVRESIEALSGINVSPDIRAITRLLGGSMLELAGVVPTIESGSARIDEVWRSGHGLARFRELIEAQGGRLSDDLDSIPRPARSVEIQAPRGGYFVGLEARAVGQWITENGGGRLVSGATLDHSIGVEALVMRGDEVRAGQPVLRVDAPAHSQSELVAARARVWIRIEDAPPAAVFAQIESIPAQA